jgi:hypothetical protein
MFGICDEVVTELLARPLQSIANLAPRTGPVSLGQILECFKVKVVEARGKDDRRLRRSLVRETPGLGD